MIWFSSDHHFGHKNIIKYANRPFESVREMNETMTEAWNAVVKPEDIVYYLGDFTLSGVVPAAIYLSGLNGSLYVLKYPWHHDKRWIVRDYPNVTYLGPLEVIKPIGFPHKITLCHYPMVSWEASFHGSWHLHGHSHGKDDGSGRGLMLDVGVDNAYARFGEFRPFSMEDVEAAMAQRGR